MAKQEKMGFNRKDPRRNECMLTGKFARRGYDWWWHSFTAVNDSTGEEVPFFIEYFLCNPSLSKGEGKAILGQDPQNKKDGGTLTLIDDIKAGHIGCEYGEFES